MGKEFEVSLTGSAGPVDGIARPVLLEGDTEAYDFLSLDESLHLLIAKDENGRWTRLSGTEPYFSGWADELGEKIDKLGS